MVQSREKSSSKDDLESQNISGLNTTASLSERDRTFYFINEVVEDQLRKYIWTGCTNVSLRDSVMVHASELIRQIIRKQGLHVIYPGQEESAFGDLTQTAWVQIEKILYKFRARPHCRNCYNPERPSDSAVYTPKPNEYGIIDFEKMIILGITSCPKCQARFSDVPVVTAKQGLFGGSVSLLYRGNSKVFNLWSQVARTVILAYIKKEARDRKNVDPYQKHLSQRGGSKGVELDRFLDEAEHFAGHNKLFKKITNALRNLVMNDEKPYDGLVSKLVSETNLSRAQIINFLSFMKLRATEFTDSPQSRKNDPKFRKMAIDSEEEE